MKKTFHLASILILALSLASCGANDSSSAASSSEVPAKTYEKVYDDSADPAVQVDEAIARAKEENKFVIAQVGGNWCRWCLMFADFISNDEEISSFINDNFVYTHINVRLKNEATGKQETCSEAMAKLGNPMRFGYPVFVVLDSDGHVLHFQDSSYLEEGEGYNKDKVMRFFQNWTPKAVSQN